MGKGLEEEGPQLLFCSLSVEMGGFPKGQPMDSPLQVVTFHSQWGDGFRLLMEGASTLSPLASHTF